MNMSFFDSLLGHLDIVIVGIVLCSGFFQKAYLKGFSLSKDSSYDSALKTLALSAIVSIIYILFLKRDGNMGDKLSGYFLSYFAATSLYELLINPFISWIKTKFPGGN